MKTLLVVDDEPVVRQLISASLIDSDWQIIEVGDGPSALDTAQSTHPDVILLDVSLPGMPGPAVLSHLRGDASTATIPVLYLTGLPPETGPRPDGVLAKPFTPSLLREVLSSY